MSVLVIALLFLAGFVSGAINAVAGGGTFISFGALTLIGVPSIVANATSSIAQLPGYITSTPAYRKDFAKMWRGVLVLAVVSAIGSLGGALFLLYLNNEQFSAVVPWLLLGATALFAAGPWLKPKPKHQDAAAEGRNLALPRPIRTDRETLLDPAPVEGLGEVHEEPLGPAFLAELDVENLWRAHFCPRNRCHLSAA